MVFAQVEHRRGARIKRPLGFELVARELEHPDGRRRLPSHYGLEHRRRDIAGHLGVDARALQQVAGERGDRAFAIGAGHCEHRHAVFPGEQLDIAQQRDRARQRLADQRRVERQSWADASEINAFEQCRREWPQAHITGKASRRRGTRIGDAHARSVVLGPARNRKPGVAESQHEHAFAREMHSLGPRQELESGLAHHRSLSVESPNSTSIMVMIQKRTTTWLSFQPSSS